MDRTGSLVALTDVIEALRREVAALDDPRPTETRVADYLAGIRPGLSPEAGIHRVGWIDDGVGISRRILHSEATFSVQAVRWRSGARTPVHDHIAWCVSTVLCGTLCESRYLHAGGSLVLLDEADHTEGLISAAAPPGDIHRVGNPGIGTAMSLHIYGADLRGGMSSVRRIYDQPVSDPIRVLERLVGR